MVILKLGSDTPLDNVKTTLLNHYGMGTSEYDILSGATGGEVVVGIASKDKIFESKVFTTLSDDGYKAYLTMLPPINSSYFMNFAEVEAKIFNAGIELSEAKLELIQEAHARYSSFEVIPELLIAEGKKPIDGSNAEIILHFDQAERRPKIDDSGRVDYKTIDNFVLAKTGDILLTKRFATSGVKGRDVLGNEAMPKEGQDITIVIGEGVSVNDTEVVYAAAQDGFIDFFENKISILPVYVVEGNVDYSTGNISFNGIVHIKGDVLAGFKVDSDKHIYIDGICQDCEITARGNIILKTGIKGATGYICAGESVKIGYGEKARIHSKGDIEIKKYAYNCEILSGGRIIATAEEGIIAGGHIKAFQEVSVKQLGTQGNSIFTIALGTKYFIENDLERLRKEKLRIAETIEQISFALARFDLTNEQIAEHPKVKKMLDIKKSFNNLMRDLDSKEHKLISMNKAVMPKIKVKSKVVEGVKITIFHLSSTVREPMESAVFYYDDKYNEIAWVNLKDLSTISQELREEVKDAK